MGIDFVLQIHSVEGGVEVTLLGEFVTRLCYFGEELNSGGVIIE